MFQPRSFRESPEKVDLGSMSSLLFGESMVFHSPPKIGGETESMTSLSLGITNRSSVIGITNNSSGTTKDMDNSCIEAT